MVARRLSCDEILYVPAAVNPLKADAAPTSNEHRLAMLVLAIADVPNAKISTIELDRPGPSYTIDTLTALHQQFAPPSKDRESTARPIDLRLLIGCDQALEFHRWKQWQDILKLATPVVMLRPPWSAEQFAAEVRKTYSAVEAEQWLNWTLTRGLPSMDVSATEIRERLRLHKSLDDLVDPAVAEYIRINKLYT